MHLHVVSQVGWSQRPLSTTSWMTRSVWKIHRGPLVGQLTISVTHWGATFEDPWRAGKMWHFLVMSHFLRTVRSTWRFLNPDFIGKLRKPWFELLKFKNNYSSSWFPLLPYYMFFKQNRKNKSIYHYSDRVLLLYVFGGICFCKFSILKTPMTSARNYDSSHDIPTISPWYSHGFKVIPPILRISWNPHQWETSINFIPIKYNYITMFLSSIPYP